MEGVLLKASTFIDRKSSGTDKVFLYFFEIESLLSAKFVETESLLIANFIELIHI